MQSHSMEEAPSNIATAVTARSARTLLVIEAAAFLVAALFHFGVVVPGYTHLAAGRAETVIGLALLVTVVLSKPLRSSIRTVALAGQCFALLGTLVGVVMVAIGIGPRTTGDITFHLAMLLVLSGGLLVMLRLPASR